MSEFICLAAYLLWWLLLNPVVNGLPLGVKVKSDFMIAANGTGWIQFSVVITYENWTGGNYDFYIIKDNLISRLHVFSMRMQPKGQNLAVTPNETNDARWSWKKTADVPGKRVEYEFTFSNIYPKDRGFYIFSIGNPDSIIAPPTIFIGPTGLHLSIVSRESIY